MTFHDRNFNIVHGRKGGGKDKGGSSDSKNTLRSKARAQLVEVVCEGPIKGLVDGAKSIFFDQTAVQNANGTYNFKNVSWQFNRGLPDDNYFNGNISASTPFSVETQVKKNVGPVTRTILDDNADAVRLVVRIPALFQANKESGAMEPTDLSYRISYRNYNGQWTTALDVNIRNEKTSSVYQRQHVIKLPAGGAPWDIRVERLTDDSTDERLSNELWWEAYYTIVSGKFVYPHTAALYLDVNAEDVGSSVPPRSVEIEGLIVKVPINYDPVSRTYAGLWNGAFKYAYTNNPAWVFYDLITNTRYGLGEFVDETKVDKWSLYQIAQYCDQMVSTGFRDINGNMLQEPRYTFNGVINSKEEAFNVLRKIATTWRGMAFWSLGQVYAVADMPSDVSAILTPANVLRGEFQYSGVALKAMHSVAMVGWNDPSDFYRPAVEVVINDEMLRKYGWREKSVTLDGCTSRGLAHRYGKWILDTEQHETETVSFSASYDQIELKPGAIIAIADPNKAQVRLGGRLRDCTATYADIDFPFNPLPGNSYQIMMVAADGSIVTKPITSFDKQGDDGYLRINFGAITGSLPQPNAMWVITGTDVKPRTYRVLTVREEKANEFKVTALFHDPNKYLRVEQGIILDPIPYNRPKNYIQSPINLNVVERRIYKNGKIHNTLTLSWSNAGDYKAKDYVVTMDHPTQGNNIQVATTDAMSVDVAADFSGVYTFRVRARGYANNLSDAASFSYEVSASPITALPKVENLVLAENPGGFAFRGTDVRLTWENWFATSSDPTATGGVPAHVPSPLYRTNRVRVYNTATGEILRDQNVIGEAFTYSLAMNTADNSYYNRGPVRSLTFMVTVIDTYNRESLPKSIAVSNPPPAAPLLSVNSVGSVVFASWQLAGEEDIMGSVVHVSQTPNFTPTQSNMVYDAMGNQGSFKLEENKTYYVKAAAYDRFGKSGLNYSTEATVTTGSFVDTTPPAIPTNLVVTSALSNGKARVTVTWNANTELDLAGYDLLIKQGSGNFVSFPVVSGPFEFDAIPGVSYQVKIRARDMSGNASDYTAVVSHTAVKDTTPPGVPTGATVSAGLNAFWLSWTNPADADLDYVEILENTTNNVATATVIGTSVGNSFARTGLGNQVTRYYWLRAVDTSGNKSATTAALNGTTATLIETKRVQITGLTLTPNSPATNSVAWTAFSIAVGVPGSAPVTANVVAGNAAWTTGSLYLYYVEGETILRTTTNISTIYTNSGYPIAVYRGDNDVQMADGKVMIDGSNILAGTIGAQQLVTNSAIITGTAQIADAVISSAKIIELDAAKLKAATAIAGSITVAGTALSTIKGQAGDPATVINGASTLIDPGKIVISGSTTLANWRSGADATKIEGGNIAANSIKANSVDIGLRGITIENLTFEHNSPTTNKVSWTAGTISYTDNTGANVSRSIAADNATWTAGTVYIYWVQGATTLSTTTDFATANANNNVILAAYKGGVWLNANYGRTVVDGGSIKTGSITATQLAVNSVTASAISVTSLSAVSANAGTITAGLLQSSDGKMQVDLSNKRILMAD